MSLKIHDIRFPQVYCEHLDLRIKDQLFFTRVLFGVLIFFFLKIMLESWGCGLYTSAAYTRVFTVFLWLSQIIRKHVLQHNPNSNVSSLRELETSLLKMGEKLNSNDVLLAGDFNIPNINWNNDSVVEGCSSQLPANTLLNIQGECGFKQLVHEATRSQHNAKNILDLVFTNNESMVESIKVVP